MEMFIQSLPHIAGPASALIVLLIVIWFLIRAFEPLLREYIHNNKVAFERTLEQHEKDRQVFLNSMELLGEKVHLIVTEIVTIRKDVDNIKEELDIR
jgi:hypothetical protein